MDAYLVGSVRHVAEHSHNTLPFAVPIDVIHYHNYTSY